MNAGASAAGRERRGLRRNAPVWLAFALLALLFAVAAQARAAAAVPGADEPAFAAAFAAWLDDDDATALPVFAALAAEGNPAARILLSLIDRMPETHAPFVASLTRAERRALMRDPEGTAWIEREAEVPLARLWLERWDADTDPATAFAFHDLGEARAARLTLLALSARQFRGFTELARDPRYPDELRFLAWAEARDAPETRAALAALPPGDPQATRIDARAGDEAALAEWLLAAPVARPVAAFCTEACGEAPADCALAAYRALGSYRGLFALGPPVEALVPAEAWLATVKGVRSLPRRIALQRKFDLGDACLSRQVAITP